MQPRIKSPVFTLPGTREAILSMFATTEKCGVPRATLELVQMRVGQINGCGVCVDMHTRILKKLGESETRIFMLPVWRETEYYTAPERAALALAEAATRLSDRTDAVPDDVWSAASAQFSEEALAALVMTIAIANLWNRLNVTTGQVTGDWIEKYL